MFRGTEYVHISLVTLLTIFHRRLIIIAAIAKKSGRSLLLVVSAFLIWLVSARMFNVILTIWLVVMTSFYRSNSQRPYQSSRSRSPWSPRRERVSRISDNWIHYQISRPRSPKRPHKERPTENLPKITIHLQRALAGKEIHGNSSQDHHPYLQRALEWKETHGDPTQDLNPDLRRAVAGNAKVTIGAPTQDHDLDL